MSSTTELSLDNAIGYIAKGVGAALEEKIKTALMPHAEKVVEEAAKQLCQNLKANITNYHDHIDGSVKISLVIDGVRHEI